MDSTQQFNFEPLKYEDIKLIISKEKNLIIINGYEYPPTEYNYKIWQKFLEKKDTKILNNLSTVILDLGGEK
jgi:phosphoglycolate phosphatase-like HAD superfamily hydrolase